MLTAIEYRQRIARRRIFILLVVLSITASCSSLTRTQKEAFKILNQESITP